MTTLRILGATAIISLGSAISAQSGGIRLVKDINLLPALVSSTPEPGPSNAAGICNDPDRNALARFVRYGKRVLFTATTFKHGTELWITDGTEPGTTLIRDIRPGPLSSGISDMIVMANTVYFGADDGTSGPQLWKTDGTHAGTQPITSFSGNWGTPTCFYQFSPTELLFGFQDYGQFSYRGLWITDGTAIGTRVVVGGQTLRAVGFRFAPAGPGRAFVYRYGNDALMITDGTTAGTQDLKSFVNVQGTAMCALDATRVVLSANDGGGAGRELWVSDGTVAGTQLIGDLWPGPNSGTRLAVAIRYKGKVYFGARSGNFFSDEAIWSTDGTAAGTTRLVPSAAPTDFEILGSKLYCSIAGGPNGAGLYETDGTVAGTAFITRANGRNMLSVAGRLYFSDSSFFRLVVSDGTQAGTLSLGPNARTPAVRYIQALDDKGDVVFTANDGVYGHELWISDGTVAGTKMVKDIEGVGHTFGSGPDGFCDVNGIVYFTANDGSGNAIYRTDGTPGGTTMVMRIQATYLTRVGNRFVFSANDLSGSGQELWISDGTTAGTTLLKDIRPGSAGSLPRDFARVGDKVYFAADDGTTGVELHVTDGTVAGTHRVADIFPGTGSSLPREFARVGHGDQFVFHASNATESSELFLSDGTAAGTTILKSHPGSRSVSPREMTRIAGGVVVFSGMNANGQTGVWATDGTTGGTVVLDATLAPEFITAFDHPARAAFVAYRPTTGKEIYTTDGTVAGTTLLVETKAGGGSMNPKDLTVAGNNRIYFRATGPATAEGIELYETDGNTVQLVADLNPRGDSNPRGLRIGSRHHFVDSHGRLFFAADDGVKGDELRVLDAHPWWESVGTPCGYPAGNPTRLWTNLPKINATWAWSADNAPGGWTAFPAISLNPPALGPSCGIHLDLGLFFLVATPFQVTQPTWSIQLPVPNDQALIGLPIMGQVVYGSAGGRLAFTNGVLSVFGK